MPSRFATAQLEQEAAKFRSQDQLHQSDQSQHQREIYKEAQKSQQGQGGRDKRAEKKM